MTYSLVARDPETGDLGVAVQSHFFSVGSVVSWAEPGVGAVATQSFAEISYGPRGLALMRNGRSAAGALGELVDRDEGEASRQVAMIDAGGRVAVHTGHSCIPEASHQVGVQMSAQANMMRRPTVPRAMVEARRLLRLRRAYDAVEEAERWAMKGDMAAAADHYERAYAAAPDNLEIGFWLGLALAGAGRVDEGREHVRRAVAAHDGWAELLRRLPQVGLVPDEPELLRALLSERCSTAPS